MQVSSFVSDLIEHELQQLDMHPSELLAQAIEQQSLVMSVGKRNPGKGLICEPPKVFSYLPYLAFTFLSGSSLHCPLSERIPQALTHCNRIEETICYKC